MWRSSAASAHNRAQPFCAVLAVLKTLNSPLAVQHFFDNSGRPFIRKRSRGRRPRSRERSRSRPRQRSRNPTPTVWQPSPRKPDSTVRRKSRNHSRKMLSTRWVQRPVIRQPVVRQLHEALCTIGLEPTATNALKPWARIADIFSTILIGDSEMVTKC